MSLDASRPMMLRPSRARIIRMLLISLIFVAIGIWMTRSSGTVWGIPATIAGWPVAIFFGLGCMISAAMFLPGASYLRVEADGYTVCALFRPSFVAWDAVRGFGVTRLVTRKVVGVNLEPTTPGAARVSRFNAGITGFDGALPDTYGMTAEALAELMNEALTKARLRTG